MQWGVLSSGFTIYYSPLLHASAGFSLCLIDRSRIDTKNEQMQTDSRSEIFLDGAIAKKIIQNIFGEVHGVLQRFGLEIMICKRKNEQASPAFLQYSI
jgi:hypothetical protein